MGYIGNIFRFCQRSCSTPGLLDRLHGGPKLSLGTTEGHLLRWLPSAPCVYTARAQTPQSKWPSPETVKQQQQQFLLGIVGPTIPRCVGSLALPPRKVSKYPTMEVLGPKRSSYSGLGGLPTKYWGTWTLRASDEKRYSPNTCLPAQRVQWECHYGSMELGRKSHIIFGSQKMGALV